MMSMDACGSICRRRTTIHAAYWTEFLFGETAMATCEHTSMNGKDKWLVECLCSWR
jgi:hypothetical protein